MIIIDAHLDLAWNALQWNRNLELPVNEIRQLEKGMADPGRGLGTVALPELKKGNVALCFGTLLARSTGVMEPDLDYLSSTQAYGIAQGQLAYYHALGRKGIARLITHPALLEEHINEWTRWDKKKGEKDSPPLGIIISMESADPILEPSHLTDWWASGVRIIGPAHYGPGRYAGGTGCEEGLTQAGKKLVREMGRLNIVMDMTHLSDRAFWEAMDLYSGPLLASHNNCRALVPNQRQFSDEQFQAIIRCDGVIGAAFDNWMIRPGWRKGETDNKPVILDHIVDHIDHICQLAGNSHHVAIGSDLDGGFGREQSPSDLDTIADLQKIPGLLVKRGYKKADVAAIMHGNWLRLLRKAWIGE